jgi:serine/threonine protein kinase
MDNEKLEPQGMKKNLTEIPEESPLCNILDTGRLRKKFKQPVKIGQGGFGEVYKAEYHIDQKQYAIKIVRLHISKDKSIDPLEEIYKHRVYRELQAASKITSDNIVRYFNSWFEELNPQEKLDEAKYRDDYQRHIRKEMQEAERVEEKR